MKCRWCMAVGAAGMIATGAASYAALAEREAEPPPAPLPEPRVVALGRLEPILELITVTAPQDAEPGRLAEIRIKEGDPIGRGEILAVLDSQPRLNAAVAQAKAELARRRAVLERTSADIASDERRLLAEAEAQEATRDRARWDLSKMTRYRDRGLYEETALVDKRLALQNAEWILTVSRLALERNRALAVDGTRVDEATARAEVAVAEAALAEAEADLD